MRTEAQHLKDRNRAGQRKYAQLLKEEIRPPNFIFGRPIVFVGSDEDFEKMFELLNRVKENYERD